MSFLGRLFRRHQHEDELDEEVRTHLRMAAQEHTERGESARAGTCQSAAREFGNVEIVKEVTRDMWGVRWLETLGQDLRYGVRQLRRNPGFTTVAVVTLAFGIGANTAIFSVVNAVLIHPFPYSHPERIVSLWGAPVIDHGPDPKPYGALAVADWLTHARSFEGTAIYQSGEVNLAGAERPERVKAAEISADFFRVLGIRPYGRGFLADDSAPGHDQVAILNDQLCHRFGAPNDVIGRSVLVNGLKFTVVGVTPAGFTFPGKTQIWMPLPLPWTFGASHIRSDVIFFATIARLRPEVSLAQARDEVMRVAYPASRANSNEARRISKSSPCGKPW